MSMVCAISIAKEGDRIFSQPVTSSHLDAFGIEPDLVNALNMSFQLVRNIEAQEKFQMSDFDRVESMCFDTRNGDAWLPFNQCFRWHLLMRVLEELSTMEDHFGSD